MIIGIFSDAHGDYQAIEKALGAMQPASRLFYLGDVHEFDPGVKNCIDLLRARGVTAVKGNCDRHAVIGDMDGSYRAWLAALPREHRDGDLVFVHEPKDPEYAFDRESFHICFCGHTHRSFLISAEGSQKLLPGMGVTLDREARYIVGIGSVSRPRAAEAKVAALYDTQSGSLNLLQL